MTAKIDDESFLNGAERRAQKFVIALATAGTVAFMVWKGWRFALGYAVGAAVAYVNFVWLKRIVAGFADVVTESGKPSSSGALVMRTLMRYALMTLAAYAIFKTSRISGFGFILGLFLPVAALVCEAAYETFAAFRRG